MKFFCLILSCSVLSLCATTLAQDSGIPATDPAGGYGAPDAVMERAAAIKHAPTKTTLSVVTGILGQPITFTATVRTFATAGAPEGTVYLSEKGAVFAQFAVSPTNTSTNSKYTNSAGIYTVTNAAGANAFYFGKHTVKAQFFSQTIYNKSAGNVKFNVNLPVYIGLSNDVNIATVEAGSGPAATNGQSVSVLYSGYLAKNGHLFDDSDNHGGTGLSWVLGRARVIPGFNEGILGMQAGETRIIQIPPDQAYGKAGAPPLVPPNSTLIFLVELLPPQ